MPRFLISCPQRSDSDWTSWFMAAGSPATTSKPDSPMLRATAGVRSVAVMANDSWLITAAGVLDGAIMPTHEQKRKRSDERRVGKVCVGRCRVRWWSVHVKKKKRQ